MATPSLPATRFTELVGCSLPIQVAPMGGAGTPDLVLAVAGAGGHGMIPGTLVPAPIVAELADGVRSGTEAFGVNFLAPLLERDALETAAAKAPLVEVFYADPDAEVVETIHAGGALASWQVASVPEAQQAEAAGCDLVVVQGVEAGGRIRGTIGLLPLLQGVLESVSIPVVAAGGIATGRGLAAVLAAGADAARLGTRFIATAESGAHPVWVQGVLAAGSADAVLSETFSVLPLGLGMWPGTRTHRVLRSALEAAERLPEGDVGELQAGSQTIPLPRHAAVPPSKATSGAVEAMALYAGQSAGLVDDVRPAGEVVGELAAEASRLLRRFS